MINNPTWTPQYWEALYKLRGWQIPFIAYDYCGFGWSLGGRYTVIPIGATLVYMGQKGWDWYKAQFNFLSMYPGYSVFHGYEISENNRMGTTIEICEKLRCRLDQLEG